MATREAAINRGDTRMEVIADLLPDLICGGLTNLYRKLYDESLVNPEFSGDYLSTEGAASSLLPVKVRPRVRLPRWCGMKLPACAKTA